MCAFCLRRRKSFLSHTFSFFLFPFSSYLLSRVKPKSSVFRPLSCRGILFLPSSSFLLSFGRPLTDGFGGPGGTARTEHHLSALGLCEKSECDFAACGRHEGGKNGAWEVECRKNSPTMRPCFVQIDPAPCCTGPAMSLFLQARTEGRKRGEFSCRRSHHPWCSALIMLSVSPAAPARLD